MDFHWTKLRITHLQLFRFLTQKNDASICLQIASRIRQHCHSDASNTDIARDKETTAIFQESKCNCHNAMFPASRTRLLAVRAYVTT